MLTSWPPWGKSSDLVPTSTHKKKDISTPIPPPQPEPTVATTPPAGPDSAGTPTGLIVLLLASSALVAPMILLSSVAMRKRLSSISQQIGAWKGVQDQVSRQSLVLAGSRNEMNSNSIDALRKELFALRMSHGNKIGNLAKEVIQLRKALETQQTSLGAQVVANMLISTELRKLSGRVETVEIARNENIKAVSYVYFVMLNSAESITKALFSLPPETIQQLSQSLVDVAAFIEELEIIVCSTPHP